jgi:hypothetical protein
LLEQLRELSEVLYACLPIINDITKATEEQPDGREAEGKVWEKEHSKYARNPVL